MRRGKGEGSRKTHASGLKEVREFIPKKLRHKTGGKSHKSFYGRTWAEASRKRDEFVEDLHSGYSSESRDLTLAEYLERWLSGSLHRRVSVRTLEDYRAIAEKHLIPPAPDGIGDAHLSDIMPQDLDDLYERKLAAGVGSRSVRYAHQVISTALQNAVKKRLIPYNPARDADAPPVDAPAPRVTLSWPEVERFFETARGDRYEHLFTVAVLTGARPGELVALKWEDVSLEEPGSIVVRRSLATTKTYGLVPRETTKTRSTRPISLMPEAAVALRAQKVKQAEELLRLRGLVNDEGLVFPNTEGKYMNGNNLSRRHFKPILRRAGLPDAVRFYDLRHSFATNWVDAGLSRDILMKILGQTSGKMIEQTYVHAPERVQVASLNELGNAMRRASGEPSSSHRG